MSLKNSLKQLAILLLLLTSLHLVTSCKKKEKDTISTPKKATPLIQKNSVDVNKNKYPSVNIIPNQTVKSPLKITLNSLGLWYAFEGEIGTVRLRDATGKQLGNVGILHVLKGVDWMVEGNVPFETTITFDVRNSKKGLLVFNNNNPGEGDDKSFKIPVQF